MSESEIADNYDAKLTKLWGGPKIAYFNDAFDSWPRTYDSGKGQERRRAAPACEAACVRLCAARNWSTRPRLPGTPPWYRPRTLLRVGCQARMRRVVPCRTCRGRDASQERAVLV